MAEIILLKIVAILILINISAFFSGSETAFFSLTTLDLEKIKSENNILSTAVIKVVSDKEKLLTTILLGNEIVNVAISATTASIFMDILGSRWISLSVFMTTAFILIYGEIIPKVIAVKHNIIWSKTAALPIYFISFVLLPIRLILQQISKFVTKVFGEEDVRIGEEKFKHIVGEMRKRGIVEEKEEEMILKVFSFSELTVKEIMTPRPDIFAIPADINKEELKELIKENRYSKIPVYEKEFDNIIGYVHARDLMALIFEVIDSDLRDIIIPCYFVPETKSISELLKEFQTRRIEIAIVVDEYGSVQGLVTLEDVIEEIVGEIKDEYETDTNPIEEIAPNTYILDARVSIDVLKKLTSTEINTDEIDVDTVGGFVLHLFGRLPKINESTKYGAWKFTVTEMRKRRITKIKLEKEDEVSGS